MIMSINLVWILQTWQQPFIALSIALIKSLSVQGLEIQASKEENLQHSPCQGGKEQPVFQGSPLYTFPHEFHFTSTWDWSWVRLYYILLHKITLHYIY